MKTIISWIVAAFVLGAVIGCSESESGSKAVNGISGTVNKGKVCDAAVKIYAVNDDGSRGELLAETKTDLNAAFSVIGSYEGVIEIVATGGYYMDEATGVRVDVTAGFEFRLMIGASAARTGIGVTALSTIAAAYAKEHAAEGLETAIENAQKGVAALFGMPGDDIFHVTLPDVNAQMPPLGDFIYQMGGKRCAAILAALCQTAETNGLPADEVLKIIQDLAEDFKDGNIDGANAGGTISVTASITPAEVIAGLKAAVESFLSSGENKFGMKYEELGFTF